MSSERLYIPTTEVQQSVMEPSSFTPPKSFGFLDKGPPSRQGSLCGSLGGTLKMNRTLTENDFVRLRRVSQPPSQPPSPPPEEVFAGDDMLQDLERKDREWLQFRREERLRQEEEDLVAYNMRLVQRKKQYYLNQHPAMLGEASEPIISEEDRKSFTILVGIDKKKAKEHAAGLVTATQGSCHKDNHVILLNCFSKNTAKRAEETTAHLEQIKKELIDSTPGLSCETACCHSTKDKVSSIVEYSTKMNVDLMVLGMREEDKGFFDRKVSPGVIESCPEDKAVLLVPPPSSRQPERGMGRTVLFCFDAAPQGERALLYLAHIVKPTDTVVVFNAVTPPPKLVVVAQTNDRASLQPNQMYDTILQDRVTTAERLLSRTREKLLSTLPELPSGNVVTELRILEPGKRNLGGLVLEVAKVIESHLIVMSTKGLDGWQKVVQGSVALPQHSDTPRRALLIVR